ncbi:hypothetical protein VTK73DRAFT_6355 [Phialemonium thermophilum]|uniref:Uncharacterized protein n=1 Tax=Phialemonium thermophilum TaxID=223376 RepID=A0ABR3UZR8_9PEZI
MMRGSYGLGLRTVSWSAGFSVATSQCRNTYPLLSAEKRPLCIPLARDDTRASGSESSYFPVCCEALLLLGEHGRSGRQVRAASRGSAFTPFTHLPSQLRRYLPLCGLKARSGGRKETRPNEACKAPVFVYSRCPYPTKWVCDRMGTPAATEVPVSAAHALSSPITG